MSLGDGVLLLCIQLLLLTVGAQQATKLLFKGYSPPTVFSFGATFYGPQSMFALTMSCSCTLFLLVFSEISHLFDKKTRWYYWQWNLNILLLLVILVLPWYQMYSILKYSRGWRSRSAMYGATLTFLAYIYLLIQFSFLNESTKEYTWVEASIFRVSTIGITLIAALSGFGVVHTPYVTWTAFTKKISEKDYNSAEHAYEQTRKILHDKGLQLKRLKSQLLKDQVSEVPSNRVSHWISSWMNSSDTQEHELLETEISQLEGLCATMKLNVDELARVRAKSQFSQTWRGQCWNLVGIVFTGYCIYRLIMTSFNVLTQKLGSSDPITDMLSLMISHVDGRESQIDTFFWSQQLSFWFAGIIVFGSVRGFITLVTRLIRSWSHTMSLSISSSSLLCAAHMMGIYFLSSVLMMQTSLPLEYRYLVSSSLGPIEVDYFRRWSDVTSILSSVVTALILFFIHQTNDAHSLSSDFSDTHLLAAEKGQSDFELKHLN
ncbi:Abscisic acid G-protein coupled receptor-domain-containing protein [Spinellus fusiger]|nr:Abscisic acid G-protein coupled receptor-domain-containing protein [Spinellus fusiger]